MARPFINFHKLSLHK